MASADGRDELLINVQHDIFRLRTTVTDLINTIGRLTTDVAG